jgi:site-specific recombinase XerD
MADLEFDGGDITWLKIARTKTGTMSLIPLLPRALTLLHKYRSVQSNSGQLLPVISNQNLNKYLKEIARLLSISKRLSMHIARHTFATTVTLEQGVDITTVSRMLGHKDIRTTQIYSKVTKRKIIQDMQKLLISEFTFGSI